MNFKLSIITLTLFFILGCSKQEILDRNSYQTIYENKAVDLRNMKLYVPIAYNKTPLPDFLEFSMEYGDATLKTKRQKNIFSIKRNFEKEIRVYISCNIINLKRLPEKFLFQFVKRPVTKSTLLKPENFIVVAEKEFKVNHLIVASFEINFLVPLTSYKKDEQVQVRLVQDILGSPPGNYYWSFIQINNSIIY